MLPGNGPAVAAPCRHAATIAGRPPIAVCEPPGIVGGDGRRARAKAQPPARPAAPRRRLCELREHHLLRLRVHDHVRARRPRGRGGRDPRRRRRAREHVAAVHAGAADGAAGQPGRSTRRSRESRTLPETDERPSRSTGTGARRAAPWRPRCESQSSPTSTRTFTPSRRCSRRSTARRRTRSGASATSSATAREPNGCCAAGRRARRRSALPATTTSACSARSPLDRLQRRCRPRRPLDAGRARRPTARACLEPLRPSAAPRGGRALPREPARPGLGLRPQRAGRAARAPRGDDRAARPGRPQPRPARDRRRGRDASTGGIADGGLEVDSRRARWLLNPGSVGQPRDGDPRAAWLMLDFDARAGVVPARRSTAIERTQEEILARGLPAGAGGPAGASVSEARPRSARATAPARVGSPNVMPSRASASWTSSRALKIRHLTVASVISSESAISLYGSPTTSRSSSAIFRSGFSSLTARQTRVDRLELARSAGRATSSVRHVVERDDRLRPALAGAQLVEHAVLRHLEEPRRELAARARSAAAPGRRGGRPPASGPRRAPGRRSAAGRS